MSQLFGMDNIISSLQGNYNKVNNEVSKASNAKHTLGNPKLSETASSYYEELKAKHSDVEFVLVDDANVATAKIHPNVNLLHMSHEGYPLTAR